MKIIYCHHAHRQKGNPPSQSDGITEIGVKDAEIVNKLLLELKKQTKDAFKTIYTSEFFRCTKTAEIINKDLNLPIIIDKRLNEHGSNKNETWIDTQSRITELINEILEKYENDDIVVCITSGVNIAPFISKSFGLPISKNTPFLGVPSCSPIIFDFKKQ